jgi:hypothetical protein
MVELPKVERETVKLPTGADRELFFEKFGSEVCLREVIVGPLCSEDVVALRAKVNSLHNDVTTFKARLADMPASSRPRCHYFVLRNFGYRIGNPIQRFTFGTT